MIWRRIVALLVFSFSFLLPAGWSEKRWVRVAAVGAWGLGLLAVVLGLVMLGAEYDPEFASWLMMRLRGDESITIAVSLIFIFFLPLELQISRVGGSCLILNPGMNLLISSIRFIWSCMTVSFLVLCLNVSGRLFLFFPMTLFLPVYIVLMAAIGLGSLGAQFSKTSLAIFLWSHGFYFWCILSSQIFLKGTFSSEELLFSRIIFLFLILLHLFQARHLPRVLIFSEVCRFGSPGESESSSISRERSFPDNLMWRLQKGTEEVILGFSKSRGLLMYEFIGKLFKRFVFVPLYALVVCYLISFLSAEDETTARLFASLPFVACCLATLKLNSGRFSMSIFKLSRNDQLIGQVVHPLILGIILTGLFFSIAALVVPDIFARLKFSVYLLGFSSFLWNELISVFPNDGANRIHRISFFYLLNTFLLLFLYSLSPHQTAFILLVLCCLRALYLYRTIRSGDLE